MSDENERTEHAKRILDILARLRKSTPWLAVRIIIGLAVIAGVLAVLWFAIIRPLLNGIGIVFTEIMAAFRGADPNLRLCVVSAMVLLVIGVIFWRPKRPTVNNTAEASIEPFQLNVLAGEGQRFTRQHVVWVNMLPAPTQYVSATHLSVYITQQHLIANTAGVPNIIVEVKRSNVPT